MAARAAVTTLLATDPEMNMLGFDEDVFWGSNATDSPDRDRPFAVVKWDDVQLSGGRGVYLVSIWYHLSKEGVRDYGKIDMAILRTKELMKTAEHVSGEDGWSLTSATHVTDSPDMFDDGYNSLTRYTQFRCACRNVE